MTPLTEIPENLHQAELALLSMSREPPETAWRLLSAVGDRDLGSRDLRTLKERAGLEKDEFERLLLWHGARQCLPRLELLEIADSVRIKLRQELQQLHSVPVPLEVGSYAFERAAKIATLRRFPAGPMEWEYSGIPRSLLFQAKFPANIRLLSFILRRMGGFSPCFFMHLAPPPRNRGLSMPKEVLRTYYRIACSLKLQRKMLGLVAHAWFHDPAAVRDNPHLQILSVPYLEHGGLIVQLAEAPPSSGVLEGNAQRREEYLAGKLRYRYSLALWPRRAAIDWADTHPELSD